MFRSTRLVATVACLILLGAALCVPTAAGALPAEYPAGWSLSPGGMLQLPSLTSDVGLCKGPSGYVFEVASDASAGGVRTLVSRVATADGTVADSWTYPEAAGTNVFLPKAVARDASGNVVVAMQDQSAGGWMVAKFSSSGTLLWDQPYAAGADRVPYAVCCDRAGAVIVTGQCSVGPGTGYDGAVVKWSSSGAFRWVKTLSGPGAVNDFLGSVGTDANNNVYVCGTLGSTSLAKAVIRSYSPAGNRRWKATAGQTTRSTGFTQLVVKGKSVYVAGSCHGSSSGLIAAKYTLGGRRQWGGVKTRLYAEGASATAMAVDRTNAVVIAGEASEIPPAGVDVPALWKLSPLGKTAWHRELTGTGWSNGGFSAVALDSQNRIYAAGFSGAGQPENGALLMRYSPRGAAQAMWTPQGESWANSELLHVLVVSDTKVLTSGIFEQGTRCAIVYRAKTSL